MLRLCLSFTWDSGTVEVGVQTRTSGAGGGGGRTKERGYEGGPLSTKFERVSVSCIKRLCSGKERRPNKYPLSKKPHLNLLPP